MNQRKLAFVYPPEATLLTYPPDCPFKTERAGLTRSRLRSLGLLGTENQYEVTPLPATPEQLAQFHSPDYLQALRHLSEGTLTPEGVKMGLGGPDTPAFPEALAYGAGACGSARTAADLLLSGAADVAFSLAGGFHHAMADAASGFCYLNDPVLACMHLASAGRRVLYLDVDAHHGDGVQSAFYRRSDVLTLSMHESGATLFPWGGFEHEVGEGQGLGFNVNVPLPAWTYDEAFLAAFQQVALPIMTAYQPDVVVVELGMDLLAGDPLTHLQMTNNVVVDVMQATLSLAKPLLVLGGGGYHVENTVRGWALAWKTCCDENDDDLAALALGGVMLGSTEWAGGLRDRERPVTLEQRAAVEPELRATIQRLRKQVFPFFGLSGPAPPERENSQGS